MELRAALGDSAVHQEPLELEGAKLEARLSPETGEALAAALRSCSEQKLGLLIRGGASKLSFANAPCHAALLLDTRRLLAPPEIDAEDGVALVAAGVTLASLREALTATGWELPLESADAASTLGGTVAAAAESPRFGPVRDFVLGLHVALASGERVKFGGRVVKNVTGYDLNKLFTGSCGTLGVIESAWLRLKPRPAVVQVLEADALGRGPGEVLAACRRSSVRLGAVEGVGSAQRVRLELAGDETAVASDSRELASQGFVAGQAVSQPEAGGETGVFRVRVTVRPTAWREVADVLLLGGGEVVSLPARGLVLGSFPLADDADERAISSVWRLSRLAAERGEGSYVVAAAPASARAGREVYGDPGETIPLQRAIKAQYDPAGILNPGRFVGGA